MDKATIRSRNFIASKGVTLVIRGSANLYAPVPIPARASRLFLRLPESITFSSLTSLVLVRAQSGKIGSNRGGGTEAKEEIVKDHVPNGA